MHKSSLLLVFLLLISVRWIASCFSLELDSMEGEAVVQGETVVVGGGYP